MSLPTNRANIPTAASQSPPEQRPWLKPEDADGWTVATRGKGRRRRVAVSVMVDFDIDQSAWLRAEAERAGVDYDEVIRQAVDLARGAHAG